DKHIECHELKKPAVAQEFGQGDPGDNRVRQRHRLPFMPIPMPLAKYFSIHDTEPLITLTNAKAGRLIKAVGGEVPRTATINDNVVTPGVRRIKTRMPLRRRINQ